MQPLLAFALALCLPLSLAAQTPGNAGVNDFWVTPGGTPGGSSCKNPPSLLTPLTITLNIAAMPSVPYVVLLSTCPCQPCFMAMSTSPCVAPAVTACGSNQFLEIGVGMIPGCSTFTLTTGTTSIAGLAATPIPVPPVGFPIKFAFQTIFLAPPACVVAPWNLLFSQAWTIGFM